MKKIPTLFVRDPANMARVLPEVHPDCQWVIDGEGVPTRKYDGTCVKFDGVWWARREVKPGKTPPPGFVLEQRDDVTEKAVGWEPAEQAGYIKYLREAITTLPAGDPHGTYELCGPKINGNPEKYDRHVLVRHAGAEVLLSRRGCEGLRDYLADFPYEGIVWHHPDGRMAKIKRRDVMTEATA